MIPGGAAAPRPLRVILDAPAEASWNMAVDDALLQLGGAPTLRLYGWAPHAVSLGWFQPFAAFADLPPGTPIVRRLTGGGAIHHGDELTFALACDLELLPRDVAASYALLHDAAIAALADLGVPCERVLAGAPPAPRPTERWCFAVAGRDDVVTARGKLLGSAQRRVHSPQPRVLHHGSLVLRRPALTPFVAALEDDLGGGGLDAATARLRQSLVQHVAGALDLVPTPGVLTTAERALAAQLRRTRYEDAALLRRR